VSATLIVPILPGRTASAAVGPHVPAAALSRELRQSLPLTLVEASDKISDRLTVLEQQPLAKQILGP
jgi:hypothetical protein